eukprot:14773281-Heterocapsa_arctica.AAC.1
MGREVGAALRRVPRLMASGSSPPSSPKARIPLPHLVFPLPPPFGPVGVAPVPAAPLPPPFGQSRAKCPFCPHS